MKFLMKNPKGTVFLRSIYTSTISKIVEKTFEIMDNIVEEVGEDNLCKL